MVANTAEACGFNLSLRREIDVIILRVCDCTKGFETVLKPAGESDGWHYGSESSWSFWVWVLGCLFVCVFCCWVFDLVGGLWFVVFLGGRDSVVVCLGFFLWLFQRSSTWKTKERECSHSLDVAELEAIRNLRIYHWDSLMVGVTNCVTCPVASISSAFPAYA